MDQISYNQTQAGWSVFLAGKGDYATTYWTSKGKYTALADELGKLVAKFADKQTGVIGSDKPALEFFRKASNAYYDLYNNGGGERIKLFREVFGFDGPYSENDSEYSNDRITRDDEWWTQENIDRVERKMDEIIVAAAHEQRIGEKAEPVTILTEGMKTPEGVKRVNDTMKAFENAREEVARVATSQYNTLVTIRDAAQHDRSIGSRMREYFNVDDLNELIEAIEQRREAENDFLRAVSGR